MKHICSHTQTHTHRQRAAATGINIDAPARPSVLFGAKPHPPSSTEKKDWNAGSAQRNAQKLGGTPRPACESASAIDRRRRTPAVSAIRRLWLIVSSGRLAGRRCLVAGAFASSAVRTPQRRLISLFYICC